MSKWGPDDYERALFATYAMTRDGMKPACYKCDGQGFTERDEEGVEIDCPYCRGSGVHDTHKETTTMLTTTVTICHNNRGGMEIHKPRCRDIARKGMDDFWHIEVSASDRAAAERKIDAQINHDFAGDYGLTIDAYLDAGEGYRCGGEVKIFPCAGLSKASAR